MKFFIFFYQFILLKHMESRCTKLKEIASFLMIKIQKWVASWSAVYLPTLPYSVARPSCYQKTVNHRVGITFGIFFCKPPVSFNGPPAVTLFATR